MEPVQSGINHQSQDVQNVYNQELKGELDKLENALLSLNPKIVEGGGTLIWKNETNQFESRRLLSLSSFRETSGTDFLSGLEVTAKLTYQIFECIKNIPKSHFNDLTELSNLIEIDGRLKGIKQIIDYSARCISMLSQNNSDGAKRIKAAEQRIFANIRGSEAILAVRLKDSGLNTENIHPTLSPESLQLVHLEAIGQFNSEYTASKIVRNIPEYKMNLADINILPETGIVIPNRLVTDCIKDAQMKKMTDKPTLREKSNREKPFDHATPLEVPKLEAVSQANPVVWEAKAITQIIPESSSQVSQTKQEIKIVDNAGVPTSHRDADHPEINHLANFKVQIDQKDGHICLTCGVIDTKMKADEFIEGVIGALKSRSPQVPPAPLRIVLHQLNSNVNESDLVNQQHAMSHYIERQLRNKDLLSSEVLQNAGVVISNHSLIVAHINTALNIASTLPSQLEDTYSYRINLDGLATLSDWTMESIRHLLGGDDYKEQLFNITQQSSDLLQDIFKIKGEFESLKNELLLNNTKYKSIKAEIEKINELQVENDESRLKLENLNTIKKELEQSLKTDKFKEAEKIFNTKLYEKQAKLSEKLIEFARISNGFQNMLSKLEDKTPNELGALNKLKVLSLLISKQTYNLRSGVSYQSYSRNQEIELSLILDMMLETLTEFNCKSGLDRTGFTRGLWDSLRSMEEQYSQDFLKQGITDPAQLESLVFQKLIDLVLQQESLTYELDYLQMDLISQFDIAKTLADVSSKKPYTDSMRKKLIDTIHEKYANDPQKVQLLLDTLNYQDLIAANLLKIGQPMTIESTGMAGLKYGHSNNVIFGNPHPLKRLPMFISTEDGKIIQLYEVKRTWLGKEGAISGIFGLEHFFTPAGIALMERLSQQRGD